MDRDDDILNYLQNRLEPKDRAAFEREMAADAALAAEIDVLRAARADMAAAPGPEESDLIWARLSKSIDADAAPQPANVNRSPWGQALRYAATAALAISLWQWAVVPRLATEPGPFRPASVESDRPALQVRFTGQATLAEIGALLAPLGGTIADGPSALGIVTLSFADEEMRAEAARALAERTDLVEIVLTP